jgi:predicted transcriptional regulator
MGLHTLCRVVKILVRFHRPALGTFCDFSRMESERISVRILERDWKIHVLTVFNWKTVVSMNPEDLIETLATGSINRLSILKTIQNGPMPKTEIADRCGVSRKTVGFVDDFDEILVKQSEDGYSLTGAGAIVVRKYDDVRQHIGKDTLESLAL